MLAQTQTRYRSSAGYVGAFFQPGAGATWDVIGAQAGPTTVAIRNANAPLPPLSPTPAALRLLVNGRQMAAVSVPPTSTADPWATVIGVTRPTGITLDGRHLAVRPAGSKNAGWTYWSGSATVVIDVPAVPAGQPVTAEVSGTHPVLSSEPAVLTGIHRAAAP